ncbi:MAG: Rne/Rng family ribonuclease [Propionibacteriaceae bacterium]|jgi:ribonuclease E|nr:Rne/Rng family ribonuclease [Propionibacteriaceae bacterium]
MLDEEFSPAPATSETSSPAQETIPAFAGDPTTSAASDDAPRATRRRRTATTTRQRSSAADRAADDSPDSTADTTGPGDRSQANDASSHDSAAEAQGAPARRTRSTRSRSSAAASVAAGDTPSGEAPSAGSSPDESGDPAGSEADATTRPSTQRNRRSRTTTPRNRSTSNAVDDSHPERDAAAIEAGASRAELGHAPASPELLPGSSDSTPALTTGTSGEDPIGDALAELSHTRARRSRSRAPRREELDDLAEAIAQDSADEPEGSDSPSEREGDDETGEFSRRRRRRGGRRRRRGDDRAESDETNDDEDASEESESAAGASSEADSSESDDEGESDAVRRRRRRRRRGEDPSDAGDETDDEGAEIVVKVREPRKRNRTKDGGKNKEADDSVTGIQGSTRLEAKRQRRREGRAASRRRAPIVSEAEFLARRESVDRTMLIRQRDEYSQIAVLEDGILVEHYVDRAAATSLIGNIYLGRVQNVLPSMEAVFIDIGRGRNAVLYAGEVDWDSLGEKGSSRKVEDAYASGQPILVQVSKDPVGAKGARLTSHISIPGRYVVYAPKGHLSGVSRKLSDVERGRLKSILDSLVGDEASVVIRTAAEGASEEELVHDVNRLKAQWEVIEKKVAKGQSPQLLYAEPDLTMRIVRDLFTKDFSKLIVDGNGSAIDAHDTVKAYLDHIAPDLAARIDHWDHDASGDLFAQYRIDEQIAKALDRKVHLPSGGSLVIDRTEAMTVIDVNTGKFTGSGGNLEATVAANNLEAAEEIVRQLRLRDIGGIIVIDFIDMVLPSNRELLLRRLVECLGRDRTRHQVSEVTSLGLVQMTRKRVGTGLAEAFTKPCEHCQGLGYIRYDTPVDTQAPADGGERENKRNRRGGGGRNRKS